MAREVDTAQRRAEACVEVKPRSYLQWHYDSERRFKRGERQRQCPSCGLWFWADEWTIHKQLDRLREGVGNASQL